MAHKYWQFEIHLNDTEVCIMPDAFMYIKNVTKYYMYINSQYFCYTQNFPQFCSLGTELGVIHNNIFLANLAILGNSCSCCYFISLTDKRASYAIHLYLPISEVQGSVSCAIISSSSS